VRKEAYDAAELQNRESEQARIDLDIELKARRDEAEKEHLALHQEAVAQTQKYLDEANQQLADAIRRTNDKRLEADTVEAAARSDAKAVRRQADETAAEILGNAEDRAKAMTDEAEERTAKLVADAEDRLSQIRIERDAVAGYFESLRGVLQQAEKVTADKS
jgi:cell division septum initiation protein DivIVA